MKRFLFFFGVVIAGFMGLIYVGFDKAAVSTTYGDKLQTPLFTGFLTVGSFLLTLKTFILLKLREEVYDSESYKHRFAEMQHLNPKLRRYAPLARLGNFLIYCVLAAFATAVSQLTIGFIPRWYAASFCMALALATVSLVFYSWWQIRQNLNHWFQILAAEDNSATKDVSG